MCRITKVELRFIPTCATLRATTSSIFRGWPNLIETIARNIIKSQTGVAVTIDVKPYEGILIINKDCSQVCVLWPSSLQRHPSSRSRFSGCVPCSNIFFTTLEFLIIFSSLEAVNTCFV